MGKVHGGAMATWVDVVTSLAICALDPFERLTSVSANMSMSFLNGASIGDDLYFSTTLDKVGKNLAFTSCTILGPDKKTIILQGTHTKAFINLAKM